MELANYSALLREVEHQIVYCRYKARRQREILAQATEGDDNVPEVQSLLGMFEELEAIHVADHDRLLNQLSL